MGKQTGLIHLYYGDGKGKTTAGMGLCTRAAGSGCRVLIYQFMKDNSTSERNILKLAENITVMEGLDQEKFSFGLTPEERQEHLDFYAAQFKKVTEEAERGYDVMFLDEALYTIQARLLDEKMVLDYLQNKPANLEVILTGSEPSQKLVEAADYVSEIRKVKHPYDKGQQARIGIEM